MADSDFGVNFGDFDALESLLQGTNIEGQKLNEQAISKGIASSPISAEEKKQKRKDQAKARKQAKSAGFDSVKSHQDHMSKITEMYSAGNSNADAISLEHQSTIKNINKDIQMPIDGNEENIINGARSVNNDTLEELRVKNRSKLRSSFGISQSPANLAIPDARGTFLQAAATVQKTDKNNARNGNNALANVMPNIARPFNNPLVVPGFSGNSESPSAKEAAEKESEEIRKRSKEKNKRTSPTEGDGSSKPWWEKMQDSIDNIDENVAKLLEIAQKHTKGQSEGTVQKNINSAGDSNGQSGILQALAPMAVAIGAILAAKFGGIAAQVLNGVVSSTDKAMSKIESFITGGKNVARNAEQAVARDASKFGTGFEETFDNGAKIAKGLGRGVEATATALEGGAKSKATQFGESAANLFNKVRGGVSGLFNRMEGSTQVTEEALVRAPNFLQRSIAGGAKNSFGLVKGLGKFAAGGAMLVGGAEAGIHGYRAYKDFKTGDQIGGTAETLRTASKVEEFGGPKDMLGAIPFVGKTLSKFTPDPVKNLTNKALNFGYSRVKTALVTGTAVDAAQGGPANPEADVTGGIAGIIAGIAGAQASAKGLNFVADRIDSKKGRTVLGEIHDSKAMKDATAGFQSAGMVGAVAGLGIGGAQDILGKLGSIFQHSNSNTNSDMHQQVAKQSVSEQAQHTMQTANVQRPSTTQNINASTTMTVNIAKADVTSPDAAKKLISEAMKKQMQVQQQQQKAKEKFSTPAQSNIFGNIQNGVNAFINMI